MYKNVMSYIDECCALKIQANYVPMDEEEMMYLEGGKSIKRSTTATVASALGVGIGVVAGIGAGYCTFAGNEYRKAYNYFSNKSQSSKTKYYMTTTSFTDLITGVSYGRA